MSSRIPHQYVLESNFRIAYLIGNYIKQNLTDDEEIELEKWILESDENLQLYEELTAEETVSDFIKWFESRDTERKLNEVKQRLTFTRPLKKRVGWPYWAAACGLIIVCLIGVVLFNKKHSNDFLADVPMTNDIEPGINGAVLRWGNGKRVDLTNTADSIINQQLRIQGRELQYGNSTESIEFYEIETPIKSSYQLTLPDNTKVWLNAGSTIRYPSMFTESTRKVSITGESYFEVAKDPSHPFIVSVNGLEITALGTAFNINAYPDEPGIRTTLTEGVIKVSEGKKEKYLKPGQQLLVSKNGWQQQVADVPSVIGWTNNEFILNEVGIEEIMRMVARWYGAKVIYQHQISDHFTGTIDRNVPASHLLKLLEATGEVNFRIQRDSIIVMK